MIQETLIRLYMSPVPILPGLITPDSNKEVYLRGLIRVHNTMKIELLRDLLHTDFDPLVNLTMLQTPI